MCVEHVETEQKKTEARLTKVELENKELKQCLVSIEDKLLENSIVINGISEEKYEDPEPRHSKLNRELAHILSGNTDEEKLENASALQIDSTEHVSKFNLNKGHPIAVKFTSTSDTEMVLDKKKDLQKGIYVDHFYSVKQRSNINA